MASYFTEIWTGPIEQTQDDLSLTLDVHVQLSPKVALLAYLERYERSDSPGNYDENRFVFLIRYTPQAVSRTLPSFYERRLNRRFVVGGESGEQERDGANESRERP